MLNCLHQCAFGQEVDRNAKQPHNKSGRRDMRRPYNFCRSAASAAVSGVFPGRHSDLGGSAYRRAAVDGSGKAAPCPAGGAQISHTGGHNDRPFSRSAHAQVSVSACGLRSRQICLVSVLPAADIFAAADVFCRAAHRQAHRSADSTALAAAVFACRTYRAGRSDKRSAQSGVYPP